MTKGTRLRSESSVNVINRSREFERCRTATKSTSRFYVVEKAKVDPEACACEMFSDECLQGAFTVPTSDGRNHLACFCMFPNQELGVLPCFRWIGPAVVACAFCLAPTGLCFLHGGVVLSATAPGNCEGSPVASTRRRR